MLNWPRLGPCGIFKNNFSFKNCQILHKKIWKVFNPYDCFEIYPKKWGLDIMDFLLHPKCATQVNFF